MQNIDIHHLKPDFKEINYIYTNIKVISSFVREPYDNEMLQETVQKEQKLYQMVRGQTVHAR